jgi:NodT family efflux transporter outer membrane factor (OMF) lipoprotein
VAPPEPQVDSLLVDAPTVWDEAASGAFEPSGWADDFNDPGLHALIDEAVSHNLSLVAAAGRRDATLAGSRVGRSEVWPSLGLNGSYNESSRQVADDGSTSNDIVTSTYGANARLSWEIDLWGRLRNGYRADLADAQAAEADFRAARLSVAGRTAKAWYAALEAKQLLELSRSTLDAFLQNQRTVEEGFERGIGGALEVRLIRANVASARSSVESSLRTWEDALRNLELLLGRYPAAELEVMADWPELSASVPAGLPSELLLRRPDVIAAERAVAASQQRRYESQKALLPNLSLSLSGGTSASSLNDVLNLDAAQVLSQAWTLSQPLFQGGRLRANAARNEALERQAVANFTSVVLTAFGEVEAGLRNQASFARDFEAARVAAEESIAAEELAWERYGSGLADITTALDANRRSLNAQRSLIQVTNRRIQSRLDLYLALGGGFTLPTSEHE